MRWFPFIGLFFVFVVKQCQGLNILQFASGASTSHIMFNYNLAGSLLNSGHNITMITFTHYFKLKESVKAPKGAEEIRIDPGIPDETILEFQKLMDEFVYKAMDFGTTMKVVKMFTDNWISLTKKVLNNHELIEKLRHQKFDIVIANFFDAVPLFVVEMLKIEKLAWISTANFISENAAFAMELPVNPSYTPASMAYYSDHMSFRERVINAIILLGDMIFRGVTSTNFALQQTDIYKSVPYESRSDLETLYKQVGIMQINGEQMLNFPRPLPIGVTYLGQVTSGGQKAKKSDANAKPQQLEEPWESIYKKDSKGVIIFSLGTIANTEEMPDYIAEAFVEGFKKFSDYQIIWRIEREIPNFSKENDTHIHVCKWLPQRQLLNHPKTKLFVTHAGYNSLIESTKAGVPMIMLPLFADQPGNAKRAERNGLGLTLDKLSVTAEDVTEALNQVLGDPRFGERSKKLTKMMDTKLMPSDEELSHQIEKFVRAKWFPTLSAAQRLSFVQSLCLDVITMFVIVSALGMTLLFKFIYSLYKLVVYLEEGSRKKKK